MSRLGCVLLLLLGGCNTVAAVQALPEDWWVATEALLLAVWEDLWSVVELVL